MGKISKNENSHLGNKAKYNSSRQSCAAGAEVPDALLEKEKKNDIRWPVDMRQKPETVDSPTYSWFIWGKMASGSVHSAIVLLKRGDFFFVQGVTLHFKKLWSKEIRKRTDVHLQTNFACLDPFVQTCIKIMSALRGLICIVIYILHILVIHSTSDSFRYITLHCAISYYPPWYSGQRLTHRGKMGWVPLPATPCLFFQHTCGDCELHFRCVCKFVWIKHCDADEK